MSTKPGELVASICRLPEDSRTLPSSPVDLVKRSGYLSNPLALSRDAVAAHLRANPELVSAWSNWSQDKRVRSGWYFEAGPKRSIVSFFPDGEKIIFDDPVVACAEFILREIPDMAEIWRSSRRSS